MIRFKSIKLFCQIHLGEIFLYKLLNLKCGVSSEMYCIPTDRIGTYTRTFLQILYLQGLHRYSVVFLGLLFCFVLFFLICHVSRCFAHYQNVFSSYRLFILQMINAFAQNT